jgi:hypothetical protein
MIGGTAGVTLLVKAISTASSAAGTVLETIYETDRPAAARNSTAP